MGMGVDPWTLEEVTMDAGLPSVWGSHESIEVLKHKLLCATLELETLRANAKEEVRKREENINQLFHLLQVITHERDVARDQLQLVLKKITQPNTGELSPMSAGSLRPDSPQMRQTRGSCSMTESDSLSGTPTHHSYGTSPVESFFDAVSPPELSSFKMGIPHQQRLPENKGTASRANSRSSPVYDRASAIIDSLVMKKPLPQKGKLLQAVLEAGPMLQTLLLAGPLPQWRNPPPPLPFQVPPVDVKPHSASLLSQMIVLNSNNFAHSSLNSLNHEMLNFPSATGLCTMKRTLASPCVRSYDDLNLKRQKTQCTGGA